MPGSRLTRCRRRPDPAGDPRVLVSSRDSKNKASPELIPWCRPRGSPHAKTRRMRSQGCRSSTTACWHEASRNSPACGSRASHLLARGLGWSPWLDACRRSGALTRREGCRTSERRGQRGIGILPLVDPVRVETAQPRLRRVRSRMDPMGPLRPDGTAPSLLCSPLFDRRFQDEMFRGGRRAEGGCLPFSVSPGGESRGRRRCGGRAIGRRVGRGGTRIPAR